MSNFAPFVIKHGFVRTVSKGTCCKTGEEVDDGHVNCIAPCRKSTPFLGPIQIQKQNFGYTSRHRLVLFLTSKLSVNTAFMDSSFRSPVQLETKPMSGGSCPEAEIVTWMIQLTTFLSHQKVWEDLIANEFSHGYKWETNVSKFVSKLVRHEPSRARERWGNSLEIDEFKAQNRISK